MTANGKKNSKNRGARPRARPPRGSKRTPKAKVRHPKAKVGEPLERVEKRGKLCVEIDKWRQRALNRRCTISELAAKLETPLKVIRALTKPYTRARTKAMRRVEVAKRCQNRAKYRTAAAVYREDPGVYCERSVDRLRKPIREEILRERRAKRDEVRRAARETTLEEHAKHSESMVVSVRNQRY